jgi:hypothetical protein
VLSGGRMVQHVDPNPKGGFMATGSQPAVGNERAVVEVVWEGVVEKLVVEVSVDDSRDDSVLVSSLDLVLKSVMVSVG